MATPWEWVFAREYAPTAATRPAITTSTSTVLRETNFVTLSSLHEAPRGCEALISPPRSYAHASIWGNPEPAIAAPVWVRGDRRRRRP